MKSAVLFLIFNRPDTTSQVFETIRVARPPRLYVAADGPRAHKIDEAAKCEETRRISGGVDWPCEVKTLFREQNLGCKFGVSGGISWFFEHEEEGIILEDDVVPLPGFFDYCDELLERYREDDSVAMISGCNPISDRYKSEYSYFFSRYNHIWGWATWRRVWSNYDVSIKSWPAWREAGGLKRVSGGNIPFEYYWQDVFDRTFAGKIDTWDYQWTFTCWLINGLGALPANNQTLNIGFGPDATHTINVASTDMFPLPKELDFPLRHPSAVSLQGSADGLISSKVFKINWKGLAKKRIRQLPFIGNAFSNARHLINFAWAVVSKRSQPVRRDDVTYSRNHHVS